MHSLLATAEHNSIAMLNRRSNVNRPRFQVRLFIQPMRIGDKNSNKQQARSKHKF